MGRHDSLSPRAADGASSANGPSVEASIAAGTVEVENGPGRAAVVLLKRDAGTETTSFRRTGTCFGAGPPDRRLPLALPPFTLVP